MFQQRQSGHLRAAGARQGTRSTQGVDEDPPVTHEPARGVSGGWVNDPTATSIRVTDPNGRIEEDTIEAGVAILIWNGDFDVWHATAELLDENGQVLRTGPMRPRG